MASDKFAQGNQLEWINLPDGSRAAAIMVGGKFGRVTISNVEGLRQVYAEINLGAASGKHQEVAMEELAQSWVDAVGKAYGGIEER